MRWIAIGLVLLTSVSCNGPATLYTDEVFRASAPEIVEAWTQLPPFHDAKTKNLPQGAGLRLLQAELKGAPPGGRALVGVVLSREERRTLTGAFPNLRLVFFVPLAQADGAATITVDRQQAWTAVARAAAQQSPGTRATALFPSGTAEAAVQAFDQAWRDGGGSGVSHLFWPGTKESVAETGAFFQWAGPGADSFLSTLPANLPVHGDPGMTRPAGASGYSWRVATRGLGDFLWSVAVGQEKKPSFLPLETGFDVR